MGIPQSNRRSRAGVADTPAFDPTGHTIPDVVAYVQEHPDDVARVVALEQAGKNRPTLLAQLAP